MLRLSKILLIVFVGLQGLFYALNNIVNFEAAKGFVQGVLPMAGNEAYPNAFGPAVCRWWHWHQRAGCERRLDVQPRHARMALTCAPGVRNRRHERRCHRRYCLLVRWRDSIRHNNVGGVVVQVAVLLCLALPVC